MAEDKNITLQQSVESLARSAQALSTLELDRPTRHLLIGYVKYLLGDKPRPYPALAEYLEYYGKEFLLPEIRTAMQGFGSWDRIVELGPGTGWLLSAMGTYLKFGGVRIGIDKRDNLLKRLIGVQFVLQDLEEDPVFLMGGSDNTLVIANQFLHCVVNWKELIRNNRAEWLVVEIRSLIWKEQLRDFGGTPIPQAELMYGFQEAGYRLAVRRPTPVLHISLWKPL